MTVHEGAELLYISRDDFDAVRRTFRPEFDRISARVHDRLRMLYENLAGLYKYYQATADLDAEAARAPCPTYEDDMAHIRAQQPSIEALVRQIVEMQHAIGKVEPSGAAAGPVAAAASKDPEERLTAKLRSSPPPST